MGARSSFSCWYCGRTMKLTISTAEIKNGWSYNSTPSKCLIPSPTMLLVLPPLKLRLKAPQNDRGRKWFRIIHFRFSGRIYACSYVTYVMHFAAFRGMEFFSSGSDKTWHKRTQNFEEIRDSRDWHYMGVYMQMDIRDIHHTALCVLDNSFI